MIGELQARKQKLISAKEHPASKCVRLRKEGRKEGELSLSIQLLERIKQGTNKDKIYFYNTFIVQKLYT